MIRFDFVNTLEETLLWSQLFIYGQDRFDYSWKLMRIISLKSRFFIFFREKGSPVFPVVQQSHRGQTYVDVAGSTSHKIPLSVRSVIMSTKGRRAKFKKASCAPKRFKSAFMFFPVCPVMNAIGTCHIEPNVSRK